MKETALPGRREKQDGLLGGRWRRVALLALFIAAGIGLYVSGATEFLDFETLKSHRTAIKAWVESNFAAAVLVFVIAYFIGVTFSLPGAVWLTIAGGFVFGTVWTSIFVVVGATAGATAVFLLARYVFGENWKRKAGPATRKMEQGFRAHAFSYLLALRLVPLFPFWLVNLVPAFLGVKVRTYVVATFLGIIPGTVVYAAIGNGLDAVFEAGGTPDLSVVYDPEILGPLVGLALLALVPVAWQAIRGRRIDEDLAGRPKSVEGGGADER